MDARADLRVGPRRTLGRSVWRVFNAVKKLRAGLPLHGESVSPEVPNDLFQAHLAVYCFAGPLARGTLQENQRNPYHKANRFAWEWLDGFEKYFGDVEVYRQVPAEGIEPDFADPSRSRLSPSSFELIPCSVRELAHERTLGALFLCSGKRTLDARAVGEAPV